MPSSSLPDALVVVSGPLAGQTLPLERRELVIGRDPSCDIALTTHTQVSRRHARLVPEANGWRIEDLGSTNGTFIDGSRVQNAPLPRSARLQLGDFEALARVYTTKAEPLPTPQMQPVPQIQPVQRPFPPPATAPQMQPAPLQKRATPKWLWPALGVGLALAVAGLAFDGHKQTPTKGDAQTDVKVRRALDPNDSLTPDDALPSGSGKQSGGSVEESTGQSGDSPAQKQSDASSVAQAPSVAVAPLVNGRIAPATIARAKAATVLIVRREDSNSYAFGSGFVTGNGHQVITNRHVVTSGDAPDDCLLIFEAGTSREHKIQVPSASIELASGSDEFADDLALLSLPADESVPAPLALGASESLSETDTAWVFGFPLGVGTLTLDRELPSVSVKDASIERIQRGDVDGRDAAKVLQLGSTVTHGNSGGPVLSAAGEVVGVISSGAENTGISYAIPTIWVKRLLR